jgi:hypothetical protein
MEAINMEFFKLSKILFLSVLLLSVSACSIEDMHKAFEPSKCVSSSKVVDILALEYRDAKIKLENGKIITVNQATLKQGDNYCLEYK